MQPDIPDGQLTPDQLRMVLEEAAALTEHTAALEAGLAELGGVEPPPEVAAAIDATLENLGEAVAGIHMKLMACPRLALVRQLGAYVSAGLDAGLPADRV